MFRIVVCAFIARGQLYCGDILRHNSSTSSTTSSSSSSSPGATSTPVTSMVANQQDLLARTTNALAAVRAMQAAARAAALSGPNNLGKNPNAPTQQLPNVPDGLTGGGLQVATDANNNPLLWQGANAPVQSASGSQTAVTVTQTQQQALLQWQTFNIGKNTTLAFDQSAGGDSVGNWIAFNYVRDPSGNPSQILGSIKTLGAADSSGNPQVGGQVYMMNSNGIIFGGSSQVNAHALVASALPINYNLIQQGLLNNPDAQFLFSALPQAAGQNGTPAFDPNSPAPDGSAPIQTPFAPDGSGAVGAVYGNVVVQPGALLTAPTNADHVGGRVALIGSNVSNAGTISTPNGQTILAAGLQVGLAASSDPGLRGLNVYVGVVGDYAGSVANGLDTTHATSAPGSYLNADGTTATIPAGTALRGLIDGRRANGTTADTAVTMVGRTVDQLGAIDATTSVSLNGHIDLLAEYNAFGNPYYQPGLNYPEFLHGATPTDVSTGVVTLGAGSVTSILPELSSPDRIVGTSLALPSQINLRGQSIHLAAGSDPAMGALVLAPSGQVTLDAGKWTTMNGVDSFLHSIGQVYFDSGSTIDVSGSQDVTASVTENIVSVELRAAELANDPSQRDGVLRGQTVQVDLREVGTYDGQAWVGTPLADASGYINLVQRNVGELTTSGGSVAINAGGSVVMNAKSAIEVSGGWINYEGGNIETTKVLSDGKIFDIAQATPDRVYTGIYTGTTTTTDPKWGVTNTVSSSFLLTTYDQGYLQGGNGGSLAISAPAMVLDGKLTGQTVSGSLQRTPAGQLVKTYSGSAIESALPTIQSVLGVPTASSLSLSFQQDYLSGTTILARSPTAPTVVFTSTNLAQAPAMAFPDSTTAGFAASLGERGVKGAELDLSPDLLSTADPTTGGFGSVSVKNSDGDIRISSNLATVPGGSLSFDAANLTIDDNLTVSAPSGSLAFTVHDYSPYSYQAQVSQNDYTLPSPDPSRGSFELGKYATLSTAGNAVNDRAGQPGAGTGAFFINGYRYDATGAEVDAVSVRAYRIDLGDDSTIDVSGGVAASISSKLTFGGAGRISLLGVLDPQGSSTLPIGQDPTNSADTPAVRGWLRFDPGKVSFVGYAGIGAKSGTLTLQAQEIQIENPAAFSDPSDRTLLSPANLDPTGTLLLSPSFFGRDGIGNYSLIGLGSAALDANGNPLADTQGPGRLYVPGLYVAPSITTTSGDVLATNINPQPLSWTVLTSNTGQGALTLTPATDILPLGARSQESMNLFASGITYSAGSANMLFARGDLKIGQGASIALDPKGSVTLSGNTAQIDGRVIVPGGSITVTGGNSYLVTPDVTLPDPVLATVELGSTSGLDVAGTTVGPASLALEPGILGDVNTGAVLPGGKITVQGNIVAREDAVLDVSGASGTLKLLPSYNGDVGTNGLLPALIPTTIESDAGSITLQGGQVLVCNATLRGAAGGLTAQGGSLSVASGYYSQAATTLAEPNLEVTQTGPVLLTSGSLLGKPLVDASGQNIASLGHFAASDFWNPSTNTSVGGLTSLTLGGNVLFDGAVRLGAGRSLTVGTGGFIYSTAGDSGSQAIQLAAPSVTLGIPFQPPVATNGGTNPQISILTDSSNAPFYIAPTPGTGTLDVQAENLISLGSLSFQGISTADFRTAKNGNSVAGDLRGDGTVDIAGSLAFTVGQIYPTTAVNFMLAAYDYKAPNGSTQPGSITINPTVDASGQLQLPTLPLSAGGTLTLYASSIDQGGTLRAPFGTINLGWNGVGTAPTSVAGSPADLLAGPSLALPVTASLTLATGSQTSVSAVDPATGKAVTIPYGYSTDGSNWYDPTGTDITTLGPPSKKVALSAEAVVDEKSSVIDISGGGDLYAYQWVPGAGGTQDILDSAYVPNPAAPTMTSYAVIPGYSAGFAPYAAFGTQASETGYVAGASLGLGDIVHLDLGDGNGARDYTLLPARYALLPGAYLVTPIPGVPPLSPVKESDGASIVAGYRTNSVAHAQGGPVLSVFEVALGTSASGDANAPKSIVRARAQYTDFSADNFFATNTSSGTAPLWRLPEDAGYLRLTAAAGGSVEFDGNVSGGVQTGSSGRGGLVDISSPNDILITGGGTDSAPVSSKAAQFDLTDPLVLSADTLSKFDAESLLVGGYRTSSENGAAVTVTTGQMVVSNAGEPLSGSDIILTANTKLTLDTGAMISSVGALTNADKLLFGQVDASGNAVSGSGNGVVVRVTSDPAAQIERFGVNQTTAANLNVGASVKLGAADGATGSVIIDSTNGMALNSTTTFSAGAVAFNSGQISVQFPDAGSLRLQSGGQPTTGLVLSGASLNALQLSGASLSLLSYSSLDFYGSGQLGNASASSFILHTPEIYGDGGTVAILGKNITIDNSSGASAPDIFTSGATAGALLVEGDIVNVGNGTVQVDRYGQLALNATTSLNFSGVGALSTEGDATFTTPLLTGATAAKQQFSAAGVLTVAGTPGIASGTGLGATLTLEGASVTAGSLIYLPSGTLTLHSAGAAGKGDINVTGTLDVAGGEKAFYDLPKYTDGGQVSLVADHGDVAIGTTGVVDVSGAKTDPADNSRAGYAYSSSGGGLSVDATEGQFFLAGEVSGHGATVGDGAFFTLDTGNLPAAGSAPGSLANLAAGLVSGGFDSTQNIRVRKGDVTVDGLVKAHDFTLSADSGSINVTGRIDAHGATGGTVNLAAQGGVALASSGIIDASGDDYDNAGKGGSVQLEAGTSKFDSNGKPITPVSSAVVDLKGDIDVTVGEESIPFVAGANLAFPSGVGRGNAVVFSAAGQYTSSSGQIVPVTAGEAVTLPSATKVVMSSAGTVKLTGNGQGGSVQVKIDDGSSLRLRPVAGTTAASAATLVDAALGLNSGTVLLSAPQVDTFGQPVSFGSDASIGSDVAVLPITGTISGASSVVVEGYRVFTPVAGVIDTVESAVLTNGTSFTSQAGTATSPGPISSRLLAGQTDPAQRDALSAVLHIRPGAEIVNAADPGTATVATIAAGTTNSSVFLPSGGSFTLSGLSGATSTIVSTSGSGQIMLPDGTIETLGTTATNVVLPAGSTVVLDSAGSLTLSFAKTGIASGSATLQLANGATLGTSVGNTLTTGSGTKVSLNTAGKSSVAIAAATPVVMLNGGTVRLSSNGTITTMAGTTTSFSAGTTVTVAAGSVVTPSNAGSITYASGTGGTVQLALSQGTYQLSGSTTVNPSVGDLTLWADWNLAANRYQPALGAIGEPGMLSLRAAGNLYFNGALSDGFTSAAYDAPLLAAGTQSTSYRLVAGADLTAADFQQVPPLSSLGVGTGSVLIGQNGVGSTKTGANALTSSAVAGHYQVVRTGTGDITVAAGRDVLLLNQFATIYTAGTQVADAALGGTFDLPVLDQQSYNVGLPLGSPQQAVSYPAQFNLAGGNVTVSAQDDIAHKTRDSFGRLIDDSEQELPNNWLYRRGLTDPATGLFFQGAVDPTARRLVANSSGEVMSTAWWIDFSNFFEGIGALGGGNVTLNAGRDVLNVDAVVPTNARMVGKNAAGAPLKPDNANLVELGGGNLTVQAGRDINGGVYYVERGQGDLTAGRSVLTNATRSFGRIKTATETWLPTTLFLGKGDFSVQAASDLLLGPVGNVFLLPSGISNTAWDKTYFSTYDPSDDVEVSSLTGQVQLSEDAPDGMLYSWLNSVQLFSSASVSNTRPWLRLDENSMLAFKTTPTLAPATFKVTAFSGALNIAGDLSLSPSPTGTIELLADGTISDLNPINSAGAWGYGTVRLLDSAPTDFPGPASPLATVAWSVPNITFNPQSIYAGVDGLLTEGESTENDSLTTKLARHSSGPLHATDDSPLRVYSADGDITGLALLAGKSARVVAANDLTDVSLMLQNNRAVDVSLVAAGRDLLAFDPNSPVRQTAAAAPFVRSDEAIAGESGRIEIGGPGTLEVFAGRNLNLGVDPANTAPGIVSIGNDRNPNLPFGGADIAVAAGLGNIYTSAASAKLLAPGLLSTNADWSGFVTKFLDAGTEIGARYLPVLGSALDLPSGTSDDAIEAAVSGSSLNENRVLALMDAFYAILRDSGRERNDPTSPNFGTYTEGLDAISVLFPGSPLPTSEDLSHGNALQRPPGPANGDLTMATREIGTFQGGNISMLMPNGGATVGRPTDPQKADQGILTEYGGNVSIFGADSIDVGTSRIFTLRGGNEILWSTWGDIAAGSGSKTVYAAPPTRVLVDPQSADVQNDLAGLATGSGIGVLATLVGVKPGDVDLIAPVGTVDAGDAGIRASGNLNVAARIVLNASNIQVGGASAGTPPPPAPPNLTPLTAASSTSAAVTSAATDVTKQEATSAQSELTEFPSIITVEVVGYGGGDESDNGND